MKAISIDRDILNTRASALKNAGEMFTAQTLDTIDNQSTITVVQNSIEAHEAADVAHQTLGQTLVESAEHIEHIGERFFEIDEVFANKMGL